VVVYDKKRAILVYKPFGISLLRSGDCVWATLIFCLILGHVMDPVRHKRAISGSDAERFVAQMLGLANIPDGERSPDLISADGMYTPQLALEVKGGRGKGIMVDYQLHYGITTEVEYVEFFGESPPEILTLFGADRVGRAFANQPTVVYYALVDRKDTLKKENFKVPYASIQHVWGDVFFVPHEYAFYSFAVQHAMRTGRTVPGVVPGIKKVIKKDMDSWTNPDYSGRKGDKSSWQNIIMSDIRYFISEDKELLTPDGKRRVSRMQRNYEGLPSLERRTFPGPNGTSLYALVEPDHVSLFDTIERQVKSQILDLEEITAAREASVPLLQRFATITVPPLFEDVGVRAAELVHNTLSEEELLTLERVAQWMPSKR